MSRIYRIRFRKIQSCSSCQIRSHPFERYLYVKRLELGGQPGSPPTEESDRGASPRSRPIRTGQPHTAGVPGTIPAWEAGLAAASILHYGIIIGYGWKEEAFGYNGSSAVVLRSSARLQAKRGFGFGAAAGGKEGCRQGSYGQEAQAGEALIDHQCHLTRRALLQQATAKGLPCRPYGAPRRGRRCNLGLTPPGYNLSSLRD